MKGGHPAQGKLFINFRAFSLYNFIFFLLVDFLQWAFRHVQNLPTKNTWHNTHPSIVIPCPATIFSPTKYCHHCFYFFIPKQSAIGFLILLLKSLISFSSLGKLSPWGGIKGTLSVPILLILTLVAFCFFLKIFFPLWVHAIILSWFSSNLSGCPFLLSLFLNCFISWGNWPKPVSLLTQNHSHSF